MKTYGYARRCFSCLRRPVMWTGHFHRKHKNIIAGFCERHRHDKVQTRETCIGCYGTKK